MTKKISRSQWEQIQKRVKMANFQFDPKWKCLVDGLAYRNCLEHDEEDQIKVIREVQEKLSLSS